MPLDTFICGQCQGNFNDIELFIIHKKECAPEAPEPAVDVTPEAVEVPITLNSDDSIKFADALQCTPVEESVNVGSADLLSQVAQAAMVTGENSSDTKAVVIITSPQDSNSSAAAVQPILDALNQSVNVEQLQSKTPPTVQPLATTTTTTTTTTPITAATTTTATTTTTTPSSTGRRRGRPRKGEEKNVQRDAVPKEPQRLPIPEKGKDGKYHCARCKRAFPKERYFITHKCLATSDYVDISKKDVVKIEGDESEEETEVTLVKDDEEDYKLHLSEEEEEASTINPISTQQPCSVQPSGNLEVDTAVEKTKDHIQDIPVFNTEEEKMAFEQSLNVDLSGVDHMFRVHVIEQDLNENAPSAPRTGSFGLSLYSCNTCDKVFKTLSHMRLHCLIHTDLKPFKCSKCTYASNSKGNLYTHMRKHTGQFYICCKCSFKTVNKSHLLEHEATHSNVRHACEMCKKDYNTIKSLVNHIRKYHSNTRKGKEYLAKFLQGRQDRGTTVIHQCHVCNRKFKKKIDRDRHLFVHDIRDIPSVQHCELCDYSASRRIYLEKHFLKHRVIYCCAVCQDKFLSTVRLMEHINNVHSGTEENLFEQSIAASLYLPEPDDALPDQDKEFDNLPPELSAVAINNGKDSSTDTKLLITSSTDANILAAANVEEIGTVASDPLAASTGTSTSSVATTTDVEMTEVKNVEAGSSTVKTDDDLKKEESMQVDESVEEKPAKCTVNAESNTEEASASDNKLAVSSSESAMEEGSTSSDPKKSASTYLEDKTTGMTERIKLPNNSSETGENYENGEDLPAEDVDADNKSSKASDIIKRLGYRPLSLEIFQKMRQTFGHEECEFCGRLFYNRADYDPHVRTHTGDRPFQCEVCDYRAITRDNLKRHIEREHDKITFPCKECKFLATSRTQLWNHQLKHRGVSGLECPECHEKFENLKRLRNHILIKHPKMSKDEVQRITGLGHRIQRKMGRRSYKCPYCERVFIRANSELRKHIWIHEGIKPFRCPLCPHACRSKNNLQAHMLRHSNEKPFMCNDCGKAYKSKTALRWHVRSHKDGKLFKCDKCPYEATQRSHLKRHMETHDIVKRFVCHHCDYSANTLGYMKVHYTRNHKGLQYTSSNSSPVEKPNNSSDSRVYRCLSCDYLFGNLSDLKRHLKVRHHVQVQDIQTLENITASELVFQVSDEPPLYSEETNSVPAPQELDEKTASAVNILQHIIDMSQQGAFGQQQITVQSENGQMVTVNPDTIIVQEEGQEVLVSDANQELAGNQFVIQYVTPQETSQIAAGETTLDVQSTDLQDITTSTEVLQEIVQS
ncbi:zinc finger protein ZFAT isoform X2 [Octopus sinensis]|uniref:Zinc finger protein ZFAT isoform X2 n=1 Tax=Octopus sinensis TaxID=2607531 RepID=A0A6P7TBW6_9MOLL|nr:zinc finger protein ZFAT isoform X2 [Octopus sinensis]